MLIVGSLGNELCQVEITASCECRPRRGALQPAAVVAGGSLKKSCSQGLLMRFGSGLYRRPLPPALSGSGGRDVFCPCEILARPHRSCKLFLSWLPKGLGRPGLCHTVSGAVAFEFLLKSFSLLTVGSLPIHTHSEFTCQHKVISNSVYSQILVWYATHY